MKTQTWEATAQLEGKYWHITVEGLGGATQARSVKEIDEMVQDFIEAKTEQTVSADSIKVKLQLPTEVEAMLRNVERLREEADAARNSAANESRKVARTLKSSGLTVRDIGATLGVSFQRAQQLISGK